MNQDIKSQIDRAKELLEELKESCKLDLRNKIVSNRTKNLTQEVLIKMRHALDQSMYRFFEKIIAPTLSMSEKEKAKVYFPLVKNRLDLKPTLGMGKMINLDTKYPSIYKFLEAVQPYNDDYKWLNDFNKFANEKHIRLSPQEIKEENETTISNAIRVGRGAKAIMRGCLVNGIPVDSEDINTTPLKDFDPRLNVKRITWVSFNFEGSNINILWLCEKGVKDLEKLIENFSQVCDLI